MTVCYTALGYLNGGMLHCIYVAENSSLVTMKFLYQNDPHSWLEYPLQCTVECTQPRHASAIKWAVNNHDRLNIKKTL